MVLRKIGKKGKIMTQSPLDKKKSYLRRVGWTYDAPYHEWYSEDDETDFIFSDIDLVKMTYEQVKMQVDKIRKLNTKPKLNEDEKYIKKIIKKTNSITQVPKSVAESRLCFLAHSGWEFCGVEKGYWQYKYKPERYLSDHKVYELCSESEFRNYVKSIQELV